MMSGCDFHAPSPDLFPLSQPSPAGEREMKESDD